ncbi:MAG: hypothetical protein ABSH17_10580, partial [Syntrophobacteraceae bacterium]
MARQWPIHERIPAKSPAVPYFACVTGQKYYKKRVMQADMYKSILLKSLSWDGQLYGRKTQASFPFTCPKGAIRLKFRPEAAENRGWL